MKYIIMCGGTYKTWDTPKQLIKVCGEPIVARTIRLLREAGVSDIAISSNNLVFEQFGVPVLQHNNPFVTVLDNHPEGYWVDGFYPADFPVCYLLGDVVFSPEAIKTIVNTDTDDIQFFASAPPFAKNYQKKYAEPFALKVVNTEHLKQSIELVKQYHKRGLFKRHPIMWELWQVITHCDLNHIDYTSYKVINDYTCDIDYPSDAQVIEKLMQDSSSPKYMIHAMPKRMWYVEQFLIPSMLKQGIPREDIRVHNDSIGEGNLKACMHAFQEVDMSAEGTWHLQDDVIISHDFREQTIKHDRGFVCGFNSLYDEKNPAGVVPIRKLWFSFPCIRIPNKVAQDCAKFILNEMIGNVIYKDWWKDGVNDDLLFRRYVWDFCKKETALNLAPNIVDHIDWLIGGTVNSKQKKKHVVVRSLQWTDEYLVDELKQKLEEVNKCGEPYGKR